MKNIFLENSAIQRLLELMTAHHRLFVITGAGISCASGIPDYRDRNGNWKRKPPVMHQDFINSEQVRKRYWARSLIGWRFFGKALPNSNHLALRRLEELGYIQHLVTQNVDGLHQRAGSKRVIDLHGRIDTLRCLSCGTELSRRDFQHRLEQQNPGYVDLTAVVAPDGDADLENVSFDRFIVPECMDCGGVYMPKVVFYGGSVPRNLVERAYAELDQSDAVLVVGTSLMVYSAYQFCRYATNRALPVLAINQGKTRHDGHYRVKIEQPCEGVLAALVEQLQEIG